MWATVGWAAQPIKKRVVKTIKGSKNWRLERLKNKEIDEFNRNERFDKKSSITDLEKNNTLDC